jgi:flagellar basal-body rod protein FlgG
MGVVSNNVANAATPGYKQDRLPDDVGKALDLQRYAVDAAGRPIGPIQLGPQIGVSQLDLAAGPIQETSNPLDVAIAGTGFFAVQAADGQTKYTRDGGFHQDVDGSLRSRDGSAVLDQNNQPIQLPLGQGDVSVAADGTLLTGGTTPVGRLQVVDFPAGQTLLKQGNGMFLPANGTTPQPATGSQIYQGYLEASNVDMTESMVSTMNLVRAYEANQKMLQMQDETLKSAVSDVGKV